MAYICMDKGTDKCPCILMEAGQCYTCGMIRTGRCDCLAGWQGTCPYTEYVQQGKRPVASKKARCFTVDSRRDHSPCFSTVTLRVPFAYAVRCHDPGTFVMVESDGWQIPLSVMESRTGTAASGTEGHISIAINITGPKTVGLIKRTSVGTVWKVKGPYHNGLLNIQSYDPKALSIVAAKGISLMPFLNIKDRITAGMASFYLDRHKLPDSFLTEYIGELEREEMDFGADIKAISEKIKDDYDYCLESTGREPNIFLLVSPYFAGRITACLPERITAGSVSADGSGDPAGEKGTAAVKRLILPNHSTMCCGEGLCGACSHTDENGVTVRGCKCLDMM